VKELRADRFTCDKTTSIRCTLGTMANGATVTITLHALVLLVMMLALAGASILRK
jgi:hypothetical protein